MPQTEIPKQLTPKSDLELLILCCDRCTIEDMEDDDTSDGALPPNLCDAFCVWPTDEVDVTCARLGVPVVLVALACFDGESS
jgi:hypothetical protein